MQLSKNMISVETAAGIVGVTPGRIRQMLRAGELDGAKLSERLWIVSESSAKKVAKTPHNTGRPRSGEKVA